MAETENPTQVVEAVESGGGMMKKIAFAGGGVVLLVAGIFAGAAVKNLISPPAEAVADAEVVAPPANRSAPELFASLHPPLVVNFTDSAGGGHFMQITMEVMARDQKVIDAVKNHIPVIRNSLILLYGNANYEAVTTRAGKEQMLADGLKEIQRIMQERIGEKGVEALYFTGLVIQ